MSSDGASVETALRPHTGAPLSPEEKYALVRSVGQECISETELQQLLLKKPDVRCYDGFEPSGRLHIAQGLFKAINVNKCTAAGCTFIFWVADWFALMNDKMGGDLAKIRTVGEYLIEVWTAAGMDMERVQFRWSSEDITQHAEEYWKRVLDIGRRNSLSRLKKCCQIMGRMEGKLSAAQILYPLMQCGDIFFLKADICQLGLDQRKVNMLAREYCDQIGRKLKPVILSHHMISGLLEGQAKMSKSNPESAIFMEDSPEDVMRKIRNAHCPRVAQKQQEEEVPEDGSPVATAEKNPVLDYVEHIIFGQPNAVFVADGVTYTTYAAVETAFLQQALSEEALKLALVDAINRLLHPVRRHFEVNEKAKALLATIKEWRSATGAPEASVPVTEEAARTPRLVAWVPCTLKLPLGTALALLAKLAVFQGPVSLVAADWSSFAANAIGGEEKSIVATLQYNTELLQSLARDPHFGDLLSRISVVKQSAFILSDPNAYWLQAIGVGRRLDLKQVEAAAGVTLAGEVIASLMRVADAVLIGATHVLDNGADVDVNDLVVAFSSGAVARIRPSPAQRWALHDPKAESTGDDDHLYCDDTDMDIGRKVKKAFCAPNDPENGVVGIGQSLIAMGSSLKVKVTPEQGEKQYTDPATLAADYASGAIHPGDLKSAVKDALLELTKRVREHLKSAEMKKLNTAVKAAEKKATKGGK